MSQCEDTDGEIPMCCSPPTSLSLSPFTFLHQVWLTEQQAALLAERAGGRGRYVLVCLLLFSRQKRFLPIEYLSPVIWKQPSDMIYYLHAEKHVLLVQSSK